MQAAVYDTYVYKKNGGIMHFDIVVPVEISESKVLEFGKNYLAVKDQAGQPISSRECRFCHIEQATEAMESSFEKKGYHIIEMEGC